MNDLSELTRIKAYVDKARQERTNLEGQLEQIKKRLRDEFGCATAAEAQAYVDELAAQAEALEKEISEGVQAIKEELRW